MESHDISVDQFNNIVVYLGQEA